MQAENLEKVRGELPMRVLISRDPADAVARDAPVAGTSGELAAEAAADAAAAAANGRAPPEDM